MLQPGDTAPDFTLASTAGGDARLTETLESGPTVVLLNRGPWCSYCAEQLGTYSELAYDLWRNHGTDVLPVMGDPIPELVEMRVRFSLQLQLLSDPDLGVATVYTGIQETANHGRIPVPGCFVVDTDGVVRYAQVSETPADRTYANYARHAIKNGFEEPFDGYEF